MWGGKRFVGASQGDGVAEVEAFLSDLAVGVSASAQNEVFAAFFTRA
jgi:hypothetical protein